MKFIKKLIINNFQSHKYSELDFGQDLNVIIGPSDSGKTSIIRALKWVLYNEPSGDFFIREGESEVSVSVIFSDKTTLKRYRTKSKNGYQLISSEGIESIFEGIGTSVPQEIIDKTGIYKMLLDGDHSNAINLGEQLEGPFLLSEKTSTRANAIGRLVGVDIIDEALREVLKDVRNLNLKKNTKEESIIELNDSIKEYDYLEEMKDKYDTLKLLLEKIKHYNNKENKLVDIKFRYEKIQLESVNTNNILLELKQIDKIDEIFNSIQYKVNNYTKYNHTKIKIVNIIKTKEENNLILSKLIYLDSLVNNLNQLNKMSYSYKIINSLNKEIKHIKTTKYILKKDIDSCEFLDLAQDRINDSYIQINKYNKLLLQYKELLEKQAGLTKGRAYLNKLLPFLKQEDSLFICSDKIKLLDNLNEKSRKIKISKRTSFDLEKSLEKNKSSLNQYLIEYCNILNKVGICPYCLSRIDDKAIKHVIDYHIGG